MNLMNGLASQDLTKAQGSNFQAAQFSGMLRCSLYGDILTNHFFKIGFARHLGSKLQWIEDLGSCKGSVTLYTILCMINYYFKIQFYS